MAKTATATRRSVSSGTIEDAFRDMKLGNIVHPGFEQSPPDVPSRLVGPGVSRDIPNTWTADDDEMYEALIEMVMDEMSVTRDRASQITTNRLLDRIEPPDDSELDPTKPATEEERAELRDKTTRALRGELQDQYQKRPHFRPPEEDRTSDNPEFRPSDELEPYSGPGEFPKDQLNVDRDDGGSGYIWVRETEKDPTGGIRTREREDSPSPNIYAATRGPELGGILRGPSNEPNQPGILINDGDRAMLEEVLQRILMSSSRQMR